MMEKRDGGMDWNISGIKMENTEKKDKGRKTEKSLRSKDRERTGMKQPEKGRKEKHWGIRKKLAVVFCAGALLCGIGTGVCLVEWSSFEYLGKKSIGGDEVETKTITENLYRGVSGNGKVYVHSYFGDNVQATLETSEEVPEGQIQFVVEYNPNNIKDVYVDREELEGNDPYYEGYYDSYYGTTGYSGDVEYAPQDETATAEESTTVEYSFAAQDGQQAGAQNTAQQESTSYVTYMVNSVFAQDNSLEVLFTYKDEILQNIKEKRFYEYEYEGISSVKVRIHPSNRDVVSLY